MVRKILSEVFSSTNKSLISGESVVIYTSLCRKLWSKVCELYMLDYKSLKGMCVYCHSECLTCKLKIKNGKREYIDLMIDYSCGNGRCFVYGVSSADPVERGKLIRGYIYNIYKRFVSVEETVNYFCISITSGGESVSVGKDAVHGVMVYVRCSLNRLDDDREFEISKSELHDFNRIEL